MTSYVILLLGDESSWEGATPEQRADTYGRHEAFAKALVERGHEITGGAELAHSREAKVVRPRGVTDGPYAETVEQLTGFYVVESNDLDDLLDVCRILTGSAEDGPMEGAVEVRRALPGDGPSAEG